MKLSPFPIILALIVSLTLPVTSASAKDWSGVVRKLESSTIQISMADSTCSAFSINKREGYFLTAAHCVNEATDLPPLAGVYALQIVFEDTDLDIAVLRGEGNVKDLHRPALGPTEGIEGGSEVLEIGYALGWPAPMAKQGIVATSRLIWAGINSTFFDFVPIPGMSGGPIVDHHGDVVGVVQEGIVLHGLGGVAQKSAAIDEILKATSMFWERIPLPRESISSDTAYPDLPLPSPSR